MSDPDIEVRIVRLERFVRETLRWQEAQGLKAAVLSRGKMLEAMREIVSVLERRERV